MHFTGERFVPNAIADIELEIEHLQRYLSLTEIVQNKVVVDAASGEGYGSNILAEHAVTVYGFDISEEAIDHAKQKYPRDNLHFVKASIESIPLPDNSVDVFVSFETIEHVNETIQENFLSEIKRVLKDDGLLIMSTPDRYHYSDVNNYHNEFHVKEFYEKEFHDFLRRYFRNIDLYYQRFQVSSILNKRGSKKLKVIEENNSSSYYGKYIVAICYNHNLLNILDLGSAVVEQNDKLKQLTNRIIQLQNEVEERNAHIIKLDLVVEHRELSIRELQNDLRQKDIVLSQDIQRLLNSYKLFERTIERQEKEKEELILKHTQQMEDLINQIKLLEDSVEEFNQLLKSKEETIISQGTTIVKLKSHIEEFAQGNDIVDQKDIIIRNQQGHIEQLLEQERKLNNILNSDGWRLLKKYYSIRDFLIPYNSKRKLFLKLIFRLLKEPSKFLKSLNRDSAKKFLYYLKTENPGTLQNRIDNVLEKNLELSQEQLKIIENQDMSKKLVFKITETPLVSVIIPVYNQWHYTYSCLQSILENNPDIDYEIIIADDVSSDDTVNIANYIENVKVIRNKENLGFLLNCNNAAGDARGEYIVLLNNDTNVQQDWLKHLVDLMKRDSTIGMVGSKLVYPDGRLQEAGGIIWNDASGWNYGRLDDPGKPEYNYVKEVDYISGASIMIRKELWQKIGGFDQRYAPAYFEDSDLAFEVRRQGYKVVYQPKSVVVHFEGISHGTDTSSGIKSYQLKNKGKFIEKWKTTLEKENFINGQEVFWARDRSRNKKTILVIDHYVPHYDKDAGSRTTYQYLKLFREMNLNVKFIGDNFYRHEPYTSELEKLGIEVLYGAWYRDNYKQWLKDHADKIDFVYLNRPHISIKYIDDIKRLTRASILYYGHDLHFVRELKRYEVEGNPEFLKSSRHWKRIEYEIFSKSDVIITLSQKEKNIIQADFPDKKVVIIPVFYYKEIKKNTINFDSRKDILFVGGFSHTPNVDAVSWFTKNIFPEIKSHLPEVKFYIVGSNPTNEIMGLASESVIVKGFVSDEELNRIYNQVKLVVIPLRYGAGVKGKTIESMYNQVPIVSTDFGVEGLQEINSIIKANNDEREFASEVIRLYQSDKQLNEIRQIYFDYINRYFSLEAATKTICFALGVEK